MFRTLKGEDGQAAGGSASSGMTMKQGWDGREVGMPYPVSLPFEGKRLLAQVSFVPTQQKRPCEKK